MNNEQLPPGGGQGDPNQNVPVRELHELMAHIQAAQAAETNLLMQELQRQQEIMEHIQYYVHQLLAQEEQRRHQGQLNEDQQQINNINYALVQNLLAPPQQRQQAPVEMPLEQNHQDVQDG